MKSIKSQREKNIQLLRIGLTCGVFILHINGDAGLFELCIQQGEKAILTPIALECLCICAVDTFLIISGYYLADTNIRNPKKVLDLFIQCGLFRLAKQIMIILTQGGVLQWKQIILFAIPQNYYITRYSVVYLLSPLINTALNSHSLKNLRKIVCSIVVCFSIIPTILALVEGYSGIGLGGINPIGDSAGGGQTIVNFFMMYIIGFWINREFKYNSTSIQKKMKTMSSLFVMNYLILFFWEFVYAKNRMWLFGTALAYCNPLVIIESVLLFIFFKSITVRSRIVNELSKSSLFAYLFGGLFVLIMPINQLFHIQKPLLCFIELLFYSIIIYLLCFCIWKCIFSVVTFARRTLSIHYLEHNDKK